MEIKQNEILPNSKQQECIDSLFGKFLVLAGPGTGKTFTVIRRIENMLLNGILPNKILCLTFSTAAANEMKERIIKKCGYMASSINIFTYHAFCNDIISNHSDKFLLGKKFRIIKRPQQIELMKEAIDEADLKVYVPANANKYFFAPDFVDIASKISSSGMDYEEYISYLDKNPDFNQKIKELEDEIYTREQKGETRNVGRYKALQKIKIDIEKAKEVWKITQIYKRKMFENSYIDFNDMINFVLNAFKEDKLFSEEIANSYSHLLVDEYQDTNALQNELIFSLVDNSKDKNIFVVGDDDQTIFTFQGALDDNIENFKARYSDTKIICLNENNRSTQTILDLSYNLITQSPIRIENNPVFKNYGISKKLFAKNNDIIKLDKKVRRWHFSNYMQELNQIIDDISQLVNSDACPKNDENCKNLSQIAIILRDRAQISDITKMLKARNIPFQIDDGADIFLIRSCILAYFYIGILINPILYSDKFFGLLLSKPFLIDTEDYNRLLKEKHLHKIENRKDFISNMRLFKDFEDNEKIQDFLGTYDYLKEYSQTHNLRDVIVEIFNRTGILSFFMQSEKNRVENIEGIKAFIDEAAAFMELHSTASLNDFLDYIEMSFSSEIPITTQKSAVIQNAIQVMTYHKSKGREFEYVYLPNLISRKWELNKGATNKYKLITELDKSNNEKNLELLRLLFVGITRAKHGLTLSFADFTDDRAENVSDFIVNLDNSYFETENFEFKSDDYLKQYVKSVSNEVFDNKKAISSFIQERIKSLSLSPSRLNDYLSCHRKFYYTKILGIDIEKANWDNANFGSCIHSVLENAQKLRLSSGVYPALDEILSNFDDIMEASNFTCDEEREKFEKAGNKMLTDYYPVLTDLAHDNIHAVEMGFEGEILSGCKITGKIDRIEQNFDGSFSLFDFKTGNPVSSLQVAPNLDREDYYNQLCFYKYAIEKLTGKAVRDVNLIFLKDINKNIQKILDDNDNKYIEDLISNTFEKINNMEFEPQEDLSSDACKYCDYKQLCKLDVL